MGLTFLLDKSGSMHPQSDDAIGSFNAFVQAQPAETRLSLYTFSHDLHCVFKDTDVAEIKPITADDYRPGGGTALYDAIGAILTEMSEGKLVILTDGQENSSRKYTNNHIKDLIRLSKVEVVYAGADLEDARELGISTRLYYDGTGTPDVMRSLETLSQ